MIEATSTDHDILGQLGNAAAPLLGSGSEAQVYALDESRIARLMRPGASIEAAGARADLLHEIQRGRNGVFFETPEVIDVLCIGGRVATIERRLPGEPLSQALAAASGAYRRRLIEGYFEAAAAIGEIALTRDYFGPLLGNADLRQQTWHGYLRRRLMQSALTCPDDLRAVLAGSEHLDLPDCPTPRLVHLDVFPANVLVAQGDVTAILDFGHSAIAGDPRLELWSALAYLDEPISPTAREEDRALGREWLTHHGLIEPYPAARKWLAGYWSHARDDLILMGWCRGVLASRSDSV